MFASLFQIHLQLMFTQHLLLWMVCFVTYKLFNKAWVFFLYPCIKAKNLSRSNSFEYSRTPSTSNTSLWHIITTVIYIQEKYLKVIRNMISNITLYFITKHFLIIFVIMHSEWMSLDVRKPWNISGVKITKCQIVLLVRRSHIDTFYIQQSFLYSKQNIMV